MILIIFSYFLLINLMGYFLFWLDKRKAVANQWRIAEKWLLLCITAGGFLGSFLAMQQFRHKTLHWQFQWAIRLSGIFYLVMLPLGWLYFAI